MNVQFDAAVEFLTAYPLKARDGLPENLFLLLSAISPIPNVDLLIRNEQGQTLLSWRDDAFYGQGWHIPGGCIRFGETMAYRIQQTALAELGCTVMFDPQPIAVRDILLPPRHELPNSNMRGHNVTILFACTLPKGYEIDNGTRTEADMGFLKWFTEIPENLLSVHDAYDGILRPQKEENTDETVE